MICFLGRGGGRGVGERRVTPKDLAPPPLNPSDNIIYTFILSGTVMWKCNDQRDYCFLFIFHFLQSHEIGPGPEFERVGFNLLGRSPLVTHFLKMRELMGKEQQPVQPVGRTEVAKLQYPFKLGHICSVVPCLYGHGLDTPSI